MIPLLRFLPLLISRGGYVIAFVAGIGATVLTYVPIAERRAYSEGADWGEFVAKTKYDEAFARARAAQGARTGRQLEDRTNAENNARRPTGRADGLRCGPFTVDCPTAGSPR